MILLAGTLICLIVVWSVMTGQRQQSYAEAELTDQDKIWIITDLHYLSQDLFDDGEAFSYIEKTAAGIMVLLTILISLNAIAIYLRKRFEVKW